MLCLYSWWWAIGESWTPKKLDSTTPSKSPLNTIFHIQNQSSQTISSFIDHTSSRKIFNSANSIPIIKKKMKNQLLEQFIGVPMIKSTTYRIERTPRRYLPDASGQYRISSSAEGSAILRKSRCFSTSPSGVYTKFIMKDVSKY